MKSHPQPLFKLGAAYYPDYISTGTTLTRRIATGELVSLDREERLKEDFERMKAQGIHTIRMGEFCWATIEPQRGQWQPEIFRQALDLADKYNIEVIFCTPTATPPKWLIDEFPDILPITRSGQKIPFGSRRHYDFHHPEFQNESRRITELFAREFGNHPAVTMWQTDNELGSHNSVFLFTEHAKKAFRDWLKNKYLDDINKLNQNWFTCFWSQHYRSFDEIELPVSSWADQNPHLELDFRRFSNEALCQFQREQILILRRLSPNREMTHNLMALFSDLCPWGVGADLDTVGFDHYQMDRSPHPVTSAWQFALMRSIKSKPFMILEQQPLQVNWQPINQRFSFDWLFLWGMQSAFQGSNSMLYFSWQRMAGGCEQYHDGVVPHDVRIPQSQQEKLIIAKKLVFKDISDRFSLSEIPLAQRDVLVVYDSESLWSHEITSQSVHYSTRKQMDLITQFCLQNALGFWLTPSLEAEKARLNSYKMIVFPGYAFEFTDSEHALLADYRSKGGLICSFPRTAYKQRNNQLSPTPAIFNARDDFYLEDYGALLEEEVERFELNQSDARVAVEGHLWAEKIKLTSNRWQTLAEFSEGSLYAGAPAVLKLVDPSGGAHIHFATVPSDTTANWNALRGILSVASCASTHSCELQLQTLTHGARRFLSAVNFSRQPASISLNATTSIINGAAYCLDAELRASAVGLDAEVGLKLSLDGRSALLIEIEDKRPA